MGRTAPQGRKCSGWRESSSYSGSVKPESRNYIKRKDQRLQREIMTTYMRTLSERCPALPLRSISFSRRLLSDSTTSISLSTVEEDGANAMKAYRSSGVWTKGSESTVRRSQISWCTTLRLMESEIA